MPTPAAPHAWIVIPETATGADGDGAASIQASVFGLSARERLHRGLLRAGATHVAAIEPAEAAATAPECSAVLVRADCFYDERLLKGLFGGR